MAHHSSQAAPPKRTPVGDVDWATIFFSLYDQLVRRAHKRFHHAPDAEAAFQHALDALCADDWCAARASYRGVGSPAAFLATCFNHRLGEYARRKWGRLHVPAWVRQRGALYANVFRRCVNGESTDAILSALAADDECDQVRGALREIRGRLVFCGTRNGEICTETPMEIAGDGQTFEGIEDEILLDAVSYLTTEHPTAPPIRHHTGATTAMAQVLRDLPTRATLSARQRAILRLRLRDGHPFRRIGEAVGCSRKMAERDFSASLEQLRGAFRGCAP